MLVVLFSWIIISFVFIGYGDMLLLAYNKLTGRQEQYSLMNTYVLGIPSLLIILPIIHIFFAINSVTLSVLCIVGILYFFTQKDRVKLIFHKLRDSFKIFSPLELFILFLFIALMLFMTARGILNYDSGCYHYQALKWIEEFRVVPGLGNLEERLGFNSNYFLLSAPFTMRFLLAEPLFAIQGLFATYMFVWIWTEIVKSNYSFKCVALLFLHILAIAINIIHFTDSSTDVLPNLLVFYITAYLVLYPEKLKTHCLLLVLIPVTILTFKLSLAFFSLLGLYILWGVLKNRDYKSLVFMLVACFLLCSLWLVRNVIVSGYLVFPMHEIDLFTFDWKVPKDVAISERNYIYYGAVWQFKNLYNSAMTLFSAPAYHLIHTYVIVVIYCILLLSPLYVAFLTLKKKIKNELLILYLIVVVSTLASYKSAPDFRFTYGLIFATLFLVIVFLSNQISFSVKKNIKIFTCVFGLGVLLVHLTATLFLVAPLNDGILLSEIVKPRVYEEKSFSPNLDFDTVQINNDVDLFVSKNASGFTMYKLPSVPDDVNNPQAWRFQSYKNLEARGASLQNGFKTKKND